MNVPMSWEKSKSVLEHIWIPVVIIGTAGTARIIRHIRVNLLDELQKQYVVTAKAKGLRPLRALVKYPLRMSLNFFVSDIGSVLPAIIFQGVLSLPTTGPLLIAALQSQGYVSCRFLLDISCIHDGDQQPSSQI